MTASGDLLSEVHPRTNGVQLSTTDTEAVREAWFAIGGWVAALAIALWHWRKQIIDAVDWILDRADDLVSMSEGVADDDVAGHPANYAYVRTPPPAPATKFATGGIVHDPGPFLVGERR